MVLLIISLVALFLHYFSVRRAAGNLKLREIPDSRHVFYDLKYVLPKQDVDMRL
jgi:hypothetical protein